MGAVRMLFGTIELQFPFVVIILGNVEELDSPVGCNERVRRKQIGHMEMTNSSFELNAFPRQSLAVEKQVLGRVSPVAARTFVRVCW